MKLGEMLLRDGRLTQAQLDETIALQTRSGGRIGTVMFELGFIDLDALTVYLGLELGIPIASGAMLERAKRSAVRLLSPEQAFAHKCVPLIIQDRQLIAAIEDPHDFENLDALARITGYRIIPRVAPEVRIFYYVERFFGVARPERFVRFGDQPRGHLPPSDSLPPPPLPGLPPRSEHPIAAPRPMPAIRPGRSTELDEAPDAIAIEANDMLEELSADHTATAEAASPRTLQPRARVTAVTHAQVWPPMTKAEAIVAIDTAIDRGAVGDAIMSFLTEVFDVGALFVVRDNYAHSGKAFGPGVDPQRVECALIPLEAPSIFRQAMVSLDGRYHGAPTPSSIGAYWFRVLRQPEPTVVTISVVTIKNRVVNVIYGHRMGRPAIHGQEAIDLAEVVHTAAAAYARLIADAKHRG